MRIWTGIDWGEMTNDARNEKCWAVFRKMSCEILSWRRNFRKWIQRRDGSNEEALLEVAGHDIDSVKITNSTGFHVIDGVGFNAPDVVKAITETLQRENDNYFIGFAYFASSGPFTLQS